MKKFLIIGVTLISIFCIGISRAKTETISLFDWAFYVDGTTYENILGDTMPTTGTLDGSGLGKLTWSAFTPGSHTFIALFDHEIDEPINTFFNEYGISNGIPDVGQSWEIDEHGWVFGDIYFNLLNGSLDNSNGVPPGHEDDVSMALGWDFTLAAGETAKIELVLADIVPTIPDLSLYLSHHDPDSGTDSTIYYSSNLEISGGSVSVPEPGTMILLGSLLLGFIGIKNKEYF